MSTTRQITEITRRKLFDSIALSNIWWAGRLDEPDFLARIYDLEALPSTDTRFQNAEGDIRQHRINNPTDWEDDWIFTDSRFKLQNGDDEIVLRFLAEMLHPLVRTDKEEVATLLASFNEALTRDGYELYPEHSISGHAVYGWRRTPATSPTPTSMPGSFEAPPTSFASTTTPSPLAAQGKSTAVTALQKDRVFIVQGRDQRPVIALETFLHFAGLRVLNWTDARELTGKPQPHTYDIVKAGMEAAAVILVIFSPDDEARLRPDLRGPDEDEEKPSGQARQNVLLEAGMAFAIAPNRTIFVQSERTRPISDIEGFNWVKLNGTWDSRNDLVKRMRQAGATVKLASENLQHHLAGPFEVL